MAIEDYIAGKVEEILSRPKYMSMSIAGLSSKMYTAVSTMDAYQRQAVPYGTKPAGQGSYASSVTAAKPGYANSSYGKK